jgi:hypothetical protein
VAAPVELLAASGADELTVVRAGADGLPCRAVKNAGLSAAPALGVFLRTSATRPREANPIEGKGWTEFFLAELLELPCESRFFFFQVLVGVADPATSVRTVVFPEDAGLGEPLMEGPVLPAAYRDSVEEASPPGFRGRRGVEPAVSLENSAADSAIDDSFGAATPLSSVHAYPQYGKARAKRAIRRSDG